MGSTDGSELEARSQQEHDNRGLHSQRRRVALHCREPKWRSQEESVGTSLVWRASLFARDELGICPDATGETFPDKKGFPRQRRCPCSYIRRRSTSKDTCALLFRGRATRPPSEVSR